MSSMIGLCGINCSQCSAYLATQNNSYEDRVKVAEVWSKEFGDVVNADDVICDGCTNNARLSKYCGICKIRSCGAEKELNSCANCSDFACEKLGSFIKNIPEAKANLELIRASLKNNQ
ncbi:DUF3795 domain-containing protein [Desnuesiella massiliensis]|uniref:DUF3795 domain-containing protein n=1 Tax=Desnuesiella massiliensis TaxID=1650662 RepID=UPI0006E1F4BC|nr:DUF3795 domain-containing protein [Desnuesiella massiliensis]